ncbi:MAG: hypothetical protein ACLFQK_03210 [Fibrobacterota bacterium]
MERKEFLLQLIGELSNFLLENKPKRMLISLHQEDDGLHLCAIDNHPRTDAEIEAIRKLLNAKKRPELSGYYGNMLGHDLFSTARLDLIGLQVKHGDVSRADNGVKIDLWLGSDRFDSRNFSIPD